MLLKRKKTLSLQSVQQRLPFRFFNFGENGVGKLVADFSKNCDCTDGKLKTGLGVKPYRSFEGDNGKGIFSYYVRELFFLRNYYEASQTYADVLYYVYEGGTSGHYDYEAKLYKVFLNHGNGCTAVRFKLSDGSERAAYSGVKGIVYYYHPYAASQPYKGVFKPIVCAHSNRLFAAKDDLTILYSSPEDSFDYSESVDNAGEIAFQNDSGAIVAIESCDGYLYVFFERGILRLYASGKASEFKVTKIPYSGGTIVGKTVGAVGERIIFATDQGLCRLDSKSGKVERICKGLEICPSEDQDHARHAAFNGKFLISYNDEKFGDYKTIAIDPNGSDAYLLYNREGLSSSNGIGLCAWKQYFFTYADDGDLPDGETYTFTAKTDFGKEDKKTLRSLLFEGTGNFNLVVESEGKRTEKTVILSGQTALPIGFTGKEFSLSFTLEKGTEINGFTAVVERLKGGNYAN